MIRVLRWLVTGLYVVTLVLAHIIGAAPSSGPMTGLQLALQALVITATYGILMFLLWLYGRK